MEICASCDLVRIYLYFSRFTLVNNTLNFCYHIFNTILGEPFCTCCKIQLPFCRYWESTSIWTEFRWLFFITSSVTRKNIWLNYCVLKCWKNLQPRTNFNFVAKLERCLNRKDENVWLTTLSLFMSSMFRESVKVINSKANFKISSLKCIWICSISMITSCSKYSRISYWVIVLNKKTN